MKNILIYISLVCFIPMKCLPQISEDFYKGIYVLYLDYQPKFNSLGLQFFEWCSQSNKKGKAYFEAKSRWLPDLANTKVGDIGFKKINGHITSFVEWKLGFNLFSKDKFLIAPCWNILNIWGMTGKNGTDNAYSTTGLSIKVDIPLNDYLMLRYFPGLEFSLSSSQKGTNATIVINSFELVTKKRWFVGLDILNFRHGPFPNENIDYDTGNRVELKIGVRLI